MVEHSYKTAISPLPVDSIRLEWTDTQRNRKIPVKIHFPKSRDQVCPVIIFSHCLGGSREGYGYLARYWSQYGYVCVHPQHPGSDVSIWQNLPPGHVMQALRAAALEPSNPEERLQDIAFILRELMNLAPTADRPLPILDLNRMGIAGHSFGSMTTLTIAGHDFVEIDNSLPSHLRFKAALAMSSPIPKSSERQSAEFGRIKIPCLHMTGTEDTIPISTTRAEERRIPFDCTHLAPSYLINFQGGDHMVFAGLARNKAREQADAFIHTMIEDSSLALWDTYLKQDAHAKDWLENGGLTNSLGTRGHFEVKHPK